MDNDLTELLDELAVFTEYWAKRRARKVTTKAIGKAIFLVIDEINKRKQAETEPVDPKAGHDMHEEELLVRHSEHGL